MILISGKTPLSTPDERLPIGIHVLDRIHLFVVLIVIVRVVLVHAGWPGLGQIRNPLEPDDLVGFRLGHVNRLLLLQLMAERAVGQVVAVGYPAGTAKKERKKNRKINLKT